MTSITPYRPISLLDSTIVIMIAMIAIMIALMIAITIAIVIAIDIAALIRIHVSLRVLQDLHMVGVGHTRQSYMRDIFFMIFFCATLGC